jgi:hypothetical protein
VATDGQALNENAPGSTQPGRLRRWTKSLSAVFAAIGIASAAIGYMTNGMQFFTKIAEFFQGRSELRSLLDTANERLGHGDFEAAWTANAKARGLRS